jgi:hypothetical protein
LIHAVAVRNRVVTCPQHFRYNRHPLLSILQNPVALPQYLSLSNDEEIPEQPGYYQSGNPVRGRSGHRQVIS